jgi:Yip1 domain
MVSIAERVKGILLHPRGTWATIDAEQTTTAALYLHYIAPLAGLAALAKLIGVVFVGFPVIARPPFWIVLAYAALYFVFELLAVDVIAFVIDWLGPRLGCPECEGVPRHIQALKVATYARTPIWIAGLVAIIPALQVIALIVGGIYAVYLLWLGLPELMKAPKHRIPVYALVTIVAAAGLYGLIRILVDAILAMVIGFGVDARDYSP